MPEFELIAACWTTAGACEPLGADDRSPVPIRDRLEAASRAGFALASFPVEHIAGVELDDADADVRGGTLIEDTFNNRREGDPSCDLQTRSPSSPVRPAVSDWRPPNASPARGQRSTPATSPSRWRDRRRGCPHPPARCERPRGLGPPHRRDRGRGGGADILVNNAGLVGSYDSLTTWRSIAGTPSSRWTNRVFYGMRSVTPSCVAEVAGRSSTSPPSGDWWGRPVSWPTRPPRRGHAHGPKRCHDLRTRGDRSRLRSPRLDHDPDDHAEGTGISAGLVSSTPLGGTVAPSR